ncbi:hypothetical protein ACFLQS_01725 [Actinomycetota bacterium]
MDSLLNILRISSESVISNLGQILIVISLIIIFALVLSIGWIVNKQSSKNITQLPKLLKERYDNREISKKEYEDIKRDIKEPLQQLRYYFRVYR